MVLLASLLLGLAACGEQDASSSAPAPAPVTSSSEPAPEMLLRAVLTGREQQNPPNTRIATVMVDNIAKARPQRGLSQAEVLIEMPVEGGITRFLALYEDYATIPKVGPVRSSRDGFLQVVLPFQPLYVIDGGSQVHKWYVEQLELQERTLDRMNYGSAFFNDRNRLQAGFSPEYTVYTSGQLISQAVEENRLDVDYHYRFEFFPFVPYNQPTRVPGGGEAQSVVVPFSENYFSCFAYDGQRYAMSQNNEITGVDREPTIDENNGEQLLFDNVLVLFAHMPFLGDTFLLDYKLNWGGEGYYFHGGRFEKVQWTKDTELHRMEIF